MTVIEGKKYSVYIGAGLLSCCARIFKEVGVSGKIVVIADSNVAELYVPVLKAALEKDGFMVCIFTFPAGEKSKSITELSEILEFLAENGLTRTDCVAALGGGVTGDLAGLAAGLYMRGIAWIQLPTTLLAAVDSSVGGKTAVDLNHGKNLAGLFYPPRAVICDTDTLKSLPGQVFADGLSEAVKTAVIGDAELFRVFEMNEYKSRIAEVISRCITVKINITDADEYECGKRKLLNFGHTPAHAIEKLSGYGISHGRAVAMGMGIMCRVACRAGELPENEMRRIIAVLESCSLPVNTAYSAAELANAAGLDKKRAGEMITLVMPQKIGLCRLIAVGFGELEGLFCEGI